MFSIERVMLGVFTICSMAMVALLALIYFQGRNPILVEVMAPMPTPVPEASISAVVAEPSPSPELEEVEEDEEEEEVEEADEN